MSARNPITDSTLADYQAQFASAEDGLATLPAWLAEQKRGAYERFAEQGFPDPRHEEWKYTNVRPIATKAYAPAVADGGSVSAAEVQTLRFGGLEADLVVLVNGVYRADLSSLDGLPDGARVCSLAEALAGDAEALSGRFGAVAGDQHSSFVTLNTALVRDGLVVELDRGVRLSRPLHVIFYGTAEDAPVGAHPRVLIHAAEQSEGTVIEHYAGAEQANGFTNVVTEVQVEAGAQLTHYLLQEAGAQAYQIGTLAVRQHRDSRFVSHNIQLGGRLARHDINAELAEPGAEVTLNGLFVVGGRQHMDTHTRIHHAAPHTNSLEGYRGVADGHGRGVFKGRVLVDRDAQKIDAQQSSANLLLSEHAEIDTKPELEIYADDVKCSHGATVGQLDKESLFYLRSRAIDAETARGLLVFAFADEVVERLDLAPIRERLEQRLVGRLPDSDMLKGFV